MAPSRQTYLQIGHDRYLIDKRVNAQLDPKSLVSLGDSSREFLPATLISWHDNTIGGNGSDVETALKVFEDEDDVWTRAFASVVVLSGIPDINYEIGHNVITHVEELDLPQGPYVLQKSTGKLFGICKLYEDNHHAFNYGLLQKSDKTFCKLSNRLIPVQSRLYRHVSDSRPLAGLRFAVKDTIDMAGLKTGYGNASYHEIYSAATTTAPVVQLLINAGAIPVGKVQTSEFAEGVDPTEWPTAFSCPQNPRGDGKQKPSSSSTGSAVACAAYDWLDFTLGTDTGGSIRHPAGVNGLFGNRPTIGSVSLEGVLGATELFNTVGIFARDLNIFRRVGAVLAPPSPKSIPFELDPPVRRIRKILYPVRDPAISSNPYRWFPDPDTSHHDLTPAEKKMESFVQSLEHQLGVTRSPFNIDILWQATRPLHTPITLDAAVGTLYSAITSYFGYYRPRGVGQFLQDYAAKHAGATPAIGKTVSERMAFGRAVSTETIALALEAMQQFAWWVENILLEEDTLLVFPQSFGLPSYTADAPDRTNLFVDGFSIYAFGYLAGVPDYTVPIGEIPFHSRVTGERGYLPVSVSLCARKGQDMRLFDILGELEEVGALQSVRAGRRMYEHDETDEEVEHEIEMLEEQEQMAKSIMDKDRLMARGFSKGLGKWAQTVMEARAHPVKV